MSFNIDVAGLDKVLAKFQALASDEKVEKVVREAVNEGAEVFELAITEATPISTDRWTDESTSLREGELKQSIELVTGGIDSETGAPSATVRFKDTPASRGKPSPSLVAYWVDRGHWIVKGGKLKRGKKGRILASSTGKIIDWHEGNAFFRRTVMSTDQKIRDLVTKRITEGLSKLK